MEGMEVYQSLLISTDSAGSKIVGVAHDESPSETVNKVKVDETRCVVQVGIGRPTFHRPTHPNVLWTVITSHIFYEIS